MKPSEEHISKFRTDMWSGKITEISGEMFENSFRSSMIKLSKSDSKECKNECRRKIGSNRTKVVDNSRYECSDNFQKKSENICKNDKYRNRCNDKEVLFSKFLIIENRIESRTHKSDKFLEKKPKSSEFIQPNRTIYEKDESEKYCHEYPHRKKCCRNKAKNRLSFESRNMRSCVNFGSSSGNFSLGHVSRKRLKSRKVYKKTLKKQMEILSFSTVDLFHGTFSPDGDMFPFTERTFVEIFIGIKSYCFHILLTIPTIESHLPSFLKEFLFSFFKSRDIDEIVVGSHKNSF